MRRILLTYILLVVGLLTAQAQFNPTQQVDPRTGRDANGNQIDPAMRVQEDSTDVEIQGLPPTLYMWHVSENLGTIQRIPADTATSGRGTDHLYGTFFKLLHTSRRIQLHQQ